jgi:exonuclease III
MAVHPVRIVALNIDSGGGDRVARICAYLDAQQADVIVLTQWRDTDPGRTITAWAGARGLHCHGLTDGGKANGIFVASKYPFTAHTRTPPGDTTGVLMLAQATTWTLLACYFPQRHDKPPFFAAVADVAAAHADEPLIVIGDLNNGHQERDRAKGGARFIGPEDFDALSGKAGLVDLWRLTHGDEAREYSYVSAPGKLSKDGNGFRIDHAFANGTYVQQLSPACHYDHQTRIKVNGKRLSNHSALIVTCTGATITEDTRTEEQRKMAERRLTDPGIYAIGNRVIWDGEAETMGIEPKTTIDLPASRPAKRRKIQTR